MNKQTNTEAVRLEYLMAAAWYWVRAEGPDENLASAMNRMKASALARDLGRMTPTPEEVERYARDNYPAHRLHE